MIEETPWIWNKGIAALCDHRMPDDFPQGIYDYYGDSKTRSKIGFYQNLATRISAGDLVWVKIDWLPVFVSDILPGIKEKFILVTGDSDHSMPSKMPGESELILTSTRVIHWFTQNYDGRLSEKISPIPIGMDFHSIQREDYWGIRKLPVRKQYEVVEMIRQKLEPVDQRKRSLYIDSQFSGRRDMMCAGAVNNLSRAELYEQIYADPVVYLQQHFLPQFEMWMRRGRFTYVLSHHGNGLDCHRSWEALVLGHVLVVQKSSLDALYRDLPVIIVDDWTMIKPQSLVDLLYINQEKEYRMEKLTNRYWIEKMRDFASRVMARSESKK